MKNSKNYHISGSIVLYNNDYTMLKKAIDSFLTTSVDASLYLIDNSPTDDLRNICTDIRSKYIFNPLNPGFGTGHNIAIKKVTQKSRYHVIINPDIYFNE